MIRTDTEQKKETPKIFSSEQKKDAKCFDFLHFGFKENPQRNRENEIRKSIFVKALT